MELFDVVLAGLAGAFAVWGARWRGDARRLQAGPLGQWVPSQDKEASYSTGLTTAGRIELRLNAGGSQTAISLTPDQARELAARVENVAATSEMR
jgi:hypothetical protein